MTLNEAKRHVSDLIEPGREDSDRTKAIRMVIGHADDTQYSVCAVVKAHGRTYYSGEVKSW